MKKLYFLLIAFCTGYNVFSQNITIPDIVLKNKLINTNCADFINDDESLFTGDVDTNDDGEIQLSEALAVYALNLSGLNLTPEEKIAVITGIEQFTNLRSLNLGSNKITGNLVFSYSHLKSLLLSQNLLTGINVDNCPNLLHLYSSLNKITTLNTSGLQNLEYVNSSMCSDLTTVNVSNCPLLNHLQLTSCNISSLNVDGDISLDTVSLGNNKLNSLDFSGFENLFILSCNDNLLTSLNLSECTKLVILDTFNNNLSALNVSTLTDIQLINCYNNNLTSLNASGKTHLWKIDCSDNEINNLNIDECVALKYIIANNNNLTTIDTNHCIVLETLECKNNQLQSLFLKNGRNETLTVVGNPEIQYVCSDEENITGIALTVLYSSPNAVVNSYCFFNPGGNNYNTIEGTVSLDIDNNGCTETELMKGVKVDITGNNQDGTTVTNSNGVYKYYVNAGTYSIAPNLEIPNFFMLSEPSVDHTFNTTGNSTEINFCIVPNGTHYDLNTFLTPSLPARPGFDATYRLYVYNKGNQIQSGSVQLVFNDDLLDFITATPIPVSSTSGNLSFEFSNILPLSYNYIDLTFNVNSPTETPAVNIDDVLSFTANIISAEPDETPEDNTYEFDQLVVGSFDPNDKVVAEGNNITPDKLDKYLHYTIRFQNTGTYETTNIVVKDMLTDNLDWSTFMPVSASHPYRTTLTKGNQLEFFFENINLAAENVNEPHSHGFVTFKIKPKNDLVIGDEINNTAEIYFDYNHPIITNTTTTSIEVLDINDFIYKNKLWVYPNPTKEFISITFNNDLDIKTVNIYNLQGQLLNSSSKVLNNSMINISQYQTGTYILEIITNQGRSLQKIIKQ